MNGKWYYAGTLIDYKWLKTSRWTNDFFLFQSRARFLVVFYFYLIDVFKKSTKFFQIFHFNRYLIEWIQQIKWIKIDFRFHCLFFYILKSREKKTAFEVAFAAATVYGNKRSCWYKDIKHSKLDGTKEINSAVNGKRPNQIWIVKKWTWTNRRENEHRF